jgi:hypothetical protein
MDHWQTKRPFGWGVALFLDRDTDDLLELTDSPVSQSRHGFALKVHHAQDVELTGFGVDASVTPAEVEISIRLGDEPPGPGTFSGVIEVPSGVLTAGDADHEDALAIGTGRWSVQVDCDPPGYAERVTVWLRRA